MENIFMSKKEMLHKLYEQDNGVKARNSMGCSESWYDPFYAVKNIFSRTEIEEMSEKELNNLIRCASEVSEALY